MSLTFPLEPFDDRRGFRARPLQDGAPLSMAEACRALAEDPAFRQGLSEILLGSEFEACFWECRPMTRAGLDAPFECVVLDSPALARVQTDASAFADNIRPGASVAAFPSLGRDARLIAPSPVGERAYPHLLAFLRAAPQEQIDALWTRVGAEIQAAIGDAPRWLSTSGLGVPWLHVRIDSRPKYITYPPYRRTH